jgi:RNA polymerase sigma factor (sigma-70 family)
VLLFTTDPKGADISMTYSTATVGVIAPDFESPDTRPYEHGYPAVDLTSTAASEAERPVHSYEPTERSAVALLVEAAADGDQEAWNALVERFASTVWAIARGHRLNAADAADVFQTTWLRLVENLDRIQQPERVGAWLATTARRECLRLLRMSGRQVVSGEDFAVLPDPVTSRSPDRDLVAVERNQLVAQLVEQLPDAISTTAAIAERGFTVELQGDQRIAVHADRQHRPNPSPGAGATPSPGARSRLAAGGCLRSLSAVGADRLAPNPSGDL